MLEDYHSILPVMPQDLLYHGCQRGRQEHRQLQSTQRFSSFPICCGTSLSAGCLIQAEGRCRHHGAFTLCCRLEG